MLVVFPKAQGDHSPRFTDHLSRVEGTTVRKLVLLTQSLASSTPLRPGTLVLPSNPCLSIPPKKEKSSGKKHPRKTGSGQRGSWGCGEGIHRGGQRVSGVGMESSSSWRNSLPFWTGAELFNPNMWSTLIQAIVWINWKIFSPEIMQSWDQEVKSPLTRNQIRKPLPKERKPLRTLLGKRSFD